MDSSNLSLYEENLKFYFVYTSNNSSEDMQYARTKIREHIPDGNITDLAPDDCSKYLDTATKKDIFIFDSFSGKAFQTVAASRALLLGPRCIISCLRENISIPNIRSPIYTLAMKDLIITLSSFSAVEKKRMSQLIGFMGGRCVDTLVDLVTHVVTDKVITKKYETAAVKGMQIMKSDWINDVWETSQRECIRGTHENFNKHRVPTFYNLGITSTGLKEHLKEDIKRIIQENGGTYHGQYSSKLINILIVNKDPPLSQKLTAALNSGKDVLTYEWICDSAEKGYAIPFDKYKINKKPRPTVSTPEKQRPSPQMNLTGISTFSSNISNISYQHLIDETLPNTTTYSTPEKMKRQKDTGNDLLSNKLDLQAAKQAGLFLDGCNIFMCGFTSVVKEKLVKIFNSGGATRYDTINSKLTHILIGNPSKKDISMLEAVQHEAVLVDLKWLVESIAQKQAITNCDKFLYRLGNQSDIGDDGADMLSPASKRNILSMNGSILRSDNNRRRLEFSNHTGNDEHTLQSQEPQEDNVMIDQYLNASVNQNKEFKVPQPLVNVVPSRENIQNTHLNIDLESESDFSLTLTEKNFLTGLVISVIGFDKESKELLVSDCKACGAVVIDDENFSGTVNYLILPVDTYTMDGIQIKAKYIVNHNWLTCAKKLNEIPKPAYYYEPILFPEERKPLVGMIIVFSQYHSDERSFLAQLAQMLGAEVHDSYRRTLKPLLICPVPNNAKYNGAISWHLPVVTCEWLLECQRRQKRVPFKKYLVGDSISPVDDVVDSDEEQSDIITLDMEEEIENNHPGNDAEIPAAPNVETPTNQRLNLLRGGANGSGGNKTPRTFVREYHQDLLNKCPTDERETLREILSRTTLETPETKRRRYENGERDTPEFAREEVLLEKRRQFLEERRTRYLPTESEKKKQKSTPWTEYKRRFWQNALGDEYESPTQCFNTTISTQVTDTQAPDPSTSRRLNFENLTTETDADKKIQELADLIKNRGKEVHITDAAAEAAPRAKRMTETGLLTENPFTEEVVGWRDPDDEIQTPSIPSRNEMRYKGVPCFSISCADSIKENVINQIEQLNGRVCQNLIQYDKTCTHLLIEQPRRSEKIVCCIAAGKWVLDINYIQKSVEAGYFLNEEHFEWGNPEADIPLTQPLEPIEIQVANAIHRYRVRIQEENKRGPFHNMRAIVRTNKDENMRNLIEAGHGEVLPTMNKPLSEQKDLLARATHIIFQSKNISLSSNDIKAIQEANVACISTAYLSVCITSEEAPQIKSYLVKLTVK